MMDLTRLLSLAGLGEASTVNGRDTSNDNNWKQTSMSPAEAKAKGYEVRVKKGALRNGDDMVEVRKKVTEGRMKDELWDQAEMMDLEDFVANAGDFGMEPEEAAEFWKTANGMDESEVNEAPEDYPNVVSTKPGDGDYEKGFMYFDKVTGELYKTHPGYKVLSPDEFMAGRDEVKSGGDFAHMSDEELQDAINDAMEQGDQGAAEEYYAELEKRSMGESQVNEYNDEDDTECNFCGSALHNGECPQCDTDEVEEEYTLEAVDVEEEEELTEAPTMDTTQLVNLMRNSGLSEEAIQTKLDEWANTPEGVGEVEPTSHGDAYDFAQSVNLSLKRYLDAQDMKVSVTESHTKESLTEAYKLYKGEVTEAKVDEEDVEEGNAYSKALADAKKAGKKEFEVDGKKHQVKESEEVCDACGKSPCECDDVKESVEIDRLRRLSGL